MLTRAIVTVTITALLCITAMAGVPGMITVQGKLTDSLGTPVSPGTRNFTFEVFDEPVGGTSLWSEDQPVTSDESGLWHAALGSVDPVTDKLFEDTVRWLQITVDDGAPTTLPRVRLLTGPYAYRVGTLDGSSGGTISSALTIGSTSIASGLYSFACGDSNLASGELSSVTGGRGNTASGVRAHVAGGWNNRAGNLESFVGAGYADSALGQRSTVCGGGQNVAKGTLSSVLGGAQNYADGIYGTILGGAANRTSGFIGCAAAGFGAHSKDDWSFVWGDGSTTTESDTARSFTIRASGGVRIYSSLDSIPGVKLFPGASAWAALSDSASKENRAPVDQDELLVRVAALPIETWNYKTQGALVRHIGPMAQDFYGAFGVGESNRHITTTDADGVALAALQALYKRNLVLEAALAKLQARIEKLEESQ